DAEKHDGKEWTLAAGFNGQVKLAKLQAMEAIQLARASIKESSKGGQIDVDSDKDLFAVLNSTERKFIPKKEEFHFCVVSARRATKIEGVRDIFMVQSQLLEAGVTPTWYVDEDSVGDYKALGLKAVVGGKLTPSRNKALEDARRLNKVCVQVSDDISAWEYRDGEKAAARDDTLMNAAHAAAKRLIVSPVAAASFILAKMRGVPEDRKPKLGGVYMLGSCARTFCGEAFARKHFILGDFFVVDKGSSVNFDEKLTLKEDYDFACSHIRAHGGVMRCNRMTLNVKHYSNSGGAVTVRNNDSEKRNIQVLTGKWPNAFRANPKRKNEVIMRWPADDDAEGLKSSKKKGAKQASKKSVRSKKVSDKKKTAVKKTVAKKVQKVCADLPSGKAILTWTGKESKQEYISRRCKKVNGKAVQTVIGLLKLKDSSGAERTYGFADLRYDLKSGYLKRSEMVREPKSEACGVHVNISSNISAQQPLFTGTGGPQRQSLGPVASSSSVQGATTNAQTSGPFCWLRFGTVLDDLKPDSSLVSDHLAVAWQCPRCRHTFRFTRRDIGQHTSQCDGDGADGHTQPTTAEEVCGEGRGQPAANAAMARPSQETSADQPPAIGWRCDECGSTLPVGCSALDILRHRRSHGL
ncbi:unnamed protein product, partial [Polarella glacialis]